MLAQIVAQNENQIPQKLLQVIERQQATAAVAAVACHLRLIGLTVDTQAQLHTE